MAATGKQASVAQPTAAAAQIQEGQPVPKKPARKKTAFDQSIESGERMRNAFVRTRHLTGYRSLSDYICAIIDQESGRLEELYNDGQPFDPEPTGVPRGRPVG
ncbi:ParB family protein [Arthrobacter sp. UYCu723]